jgi:type II secretory pathway pseudopilin PulG
MNLVRKTGNGAFTLIETLVYMAILFVILGVGYIAMYTSMDASSGLRRNTADISRAMEAGERWRDDLRNATQPVRVESTTPNETILHVPQAQAEIAYRFSSDTVSRRVGKEDWTPMLDKVKMSNFVNDRRTKVAAWRWELELQTYRKNPSHTRPLFTFIAVPTNNPAQ